MNLYQPNRKTTAARRRLLLATLLVVFLFAFDIFSGGVIRKGVRATNGFVYVRAKGIAAAIGDTGFFSTKHSLEIRINQLNSDIARLSGEAGNNRVLEDEN